MILLPCLLVSYFNSSFFVVVIVWIIFLYFLCPCWWFDLHSPHFLTLIHCFLFSIFLQSVIVHFVHVWVSICLCLVNSFSLRRFHEESVLILLPYFFALYFIALLYCLFVCLCLISALLVAASFLWPPSKHSDLIFFLHFFYTYSNHFFVCIVFWGGSVLLSSLSSLWLSLSGYNSI